MRVHFVLISALILGAAAPAAAQNEVAPVSNQTAPATVEKAQPPKPKAPTGEKICKRMTNGKVCRTAEEWRQYEQMY